jgi:hypothetical protein
VLVDCESHRRVATAALVNVRGYDNARRRGGGSADRRRVGEHHGSWEERCEGWLVASFFVFGYFNFFRIYLYF